MLTKKTVVAVSVAILAALSMVATLPWSPARADSQNSLGENPIVGSWHVTVSFDDGRPNVLALYTFNRDRNFVMGGSWPGLFGPGHGAWNQNQDTSASISLTFFRLLYAPTETNEATSALNGAFNGTLKVQANLTVSDDGQSFSGKYLLTNFDPSGNVRSTATGNLNGTLLVVEPLS